MLQLYIFSYFSTGSYFQDPVQMYGSILNLTPMRVFSIQLLRFQNKIVNFFEKKKKTRLYIPFHKFSAVAKHLIEITLGLAQSKQVTNFQGGVSFNIATSGVDKEVNFSRFLCDCMVERVSAILHTFDKYSL